MMALYDRIIEKNLLVRHITICANHIISENTVPTEKGFEQIDLFTDYTTAEEKQKQERIALESKHT